MSAMASQITSLTIVYWQWQWQWKWFYCHELHKSYHRWCTGKLLNKKWTSIRVHTSPLWYSQYTFFTHINVWHEKQNRNALFKPNNAVSKFMTKGARNLGFWAPISVVMKQNIGWGAEEQGKCASAKYGLYCRYSANINTFVIDSIMLILY